MNLYIITAFILIEQQNQKARTTTTLTDSSWKWFYFFSCEGNEWSAALPNQSLWNLFTQGVNQITLVVTVSYAIFFSKRAINFNDRRYLGWRTI